MSCQTCRKNNKFIYVLDFSREILCIGGPLTRSIIIFVIQQLRELVRRRSMLLSEAFYFEMHWEEIYWSRVFWAEKNQSGQMIARSTSKKYNTSDSKILIHPIDSWGCCTTNIITQLGSVHSVIIIIIIIIIIHLNSAYVIRNLN